MFLAVSHDSHPKGAESQRCPIWGSFLFMFTFFDVERPNPAYQHMRVGACFRVGGGRHAIVYCANASRDLSSLAEFLVISSEPSLSRNLYIFGLSLVINAVL